MTVPDIKGWKIYLSAVDGLLGGWYGGGMLFSVNDCVYMRCGQETEAITFRSEQDVVGLMREFRSKGYPCHAVPPIEPR